MAMTKKDYQLVAHAIKAQRERLHSEYRIQSDAMDDFAETMAAHFALVNDNFKKDVFLEAAGYGQDSND